jgi:hypothetical protein
MMTGQVKMMVTMKVMRRMRRYDTRLLLICRPR